MPEKDSKEWFGVAPPDLSLETRVRGSDWVYTYLMSFYQDTSKQWGTNNTLFPNVAMPNVLVHMEGKKLPIMKTETITIDGKATEREIIDHLQTTGTGALNPQQFEQMVHDIVNFLSYVADPVKTEREFLGKLVLLFLLVMIGLSYALKKEFWRDIKKADKK